jgi:pyruvate,orthophosphate dikinase
LLAIDGTSLPDRQLIGGKAWSIARMRSLGLPVPPAFVITTRACTAFLDTGSLPATLGDELATGMAWLEAATGGTFGGGPRPLLVSVRSGAAVSMPGMMDTVLNLGINDATQTALGELAGDAAFAHDTHRRFLDLYARIVLKGELAELDPQATATRWRADITQATGQSVPEDPHAQLLAAVQAVFESWNSRRARKYRQHHGIPHTLGTAVTVQAMVFGNLDAASGTGVLFSRNPLTGAPAPYGEYLARAQGEDVVSGRHTPQPLSALAQDLPRVHAELLAAAAILERENNDVQDIEFTIQHSQLYLLQTRAAKRAPAAALRFAIDMVAEGQIDIATALARVTAEQVRAVLSPCLAEGAVAPARLLAQGEPASQGVGIGVVVENTDEAERRALAGEAVVLARAITSPDDVHGMLVCRAIITEQGGATAHAALVSRDLGKPCVVGCGTASVTSLVGQLVTVDGGSGKIYAGALAVTVPDENADPSLVTLTQWAAAAAPLQVLAVAPPGPVLDLNTVVGGADSTQLAGLLAGHAVVRGGAIASPGGVRAALAAGVKIICASPRLPVLLAACEAARELQPQIANDE